MARSNPMGILAPVMLLCQLALPFSTLPLQAQEIPSDAGGEKDVTVAPGKKGMDGIAAYYANSYKGRKTRSGTCYNPEKMTAAHPTLPFGTTVKVVNLTNNREVIVTINDRCREKGFPFIDLSRAAARYLGFLGKGTARVRIMPITDQSS